MFGLTKRDLFNFDVFLDNWVDNLSTVPMEKKDGKYSVDIDVPGLSKEDITVETKGRALIVNGSNKKRNVHREFILGFEPQKVSAALDLGVLTIKVEKPEANGNIVPIE